MSNDSFSFLTVDRCWTLHSFVRFKKSWSGLEINLEKSDKTFKGKVLQFQDFLCFLLMWLKTGIIQLFLRDFNKAFEYLQCNWNHYATLCVFFMIQWMFYDHFGCWSAVPDSLCLALACWSWSIPDSFSSLALCSVIDPALPNNQPISLSKGRSVSCQIMCVWFLCRWKWIVFSLREVALGAAVAAAIDYGCVCVVCCDGLLHQQTYSCLTCSSHTLTCHSALQQRCENTAPDICFPPAEWKSFNAFQQDAEQNILMESEFDHARYLDKKTTLFFVQDVWNLNSLKMQM